MVRGKLILVDGVPSLDTGKRIPGVISAEGVDVGWTTNCTVLSSLSEPPVVSCSYEMPFADEISSFLGRDVRFWSERFSCGARIESAENAAAEVIK